MPPIPDLRDCAIPVVRRRPVTTGKRVYTNPCDEMEDCWCRVSKAEQERLAHPKTRKSYSGQQLQRPLSVVGPQPRHVLSIEDLEWKFKDLEIKPWALEAKLDGPASRSDTPAPSTNASRHVTTPASVASCQFPSWPSRAESSQAGPSHQRTTRSRLDPTAKVFRHSTDRDVPPERSSSRSRCRSSAQWPPLVITPADLESHGFQTVRGRHQNPQNTEPSRALKKNPPSSSSSAVPVQDHQPETQLPNIQQRDSTHPSSAWPAPFYSDNTRPSIWTAQISAILAPPPLSAAGPSDPHRGGAWLVANPIVDTHPEAASTFWQPLGVFATTQRLRPRSSSCAVAGDKNIGCDAEVEVEEGGVGDGGLGVQGLRDHGTVVAEEISPRPREQEQEIIASPERDDTGLPTWLVGSHLYRQPLQGLEAGASGLEPGGQSADSVGHAKSQEAREREKGMSFALQVLRSRGMRVSSSDSVANGGG